jgi:hypothetical protein
MNDNRLGPEDEEDDYVSDDSSWYGDDEDNSWEEDEFDESTHNPVDPFDRKLGRFVAEGRLNRHPKHIAVTPCNDLLREAMVYLMADPVVPERLKKAMGKKLSRAF